MRNIINRWLRLLAVLVMSLPALAAQPAVAQGNCRTFTETARTVCDKFLAYWTDNGGLAQQGFPITEVLSEISATDGKTYTVQYFERAVFEQHPEFAGTVNEVLLQLLGVFFYGKRYPIGAPNQVPSVDPAARTFTETGHRLGGLFAGYWDSHGGLSQQGFPISDEFFEINQLDGKPYKVQYFERSVFEYHPENAPPNDVLLSQLGTFIDTERHQVPILPVAPTPTTAPLPPTAPTSTPTPASICDQLPTANSDVYSEPQSRCGPPGTTFYFAARGFKPKESVGVYLTGPDGAVFGAKFQLEAGDDGYTLQEIVIPTGPTFPSIRVAVTFEGVESHVKQIEYFAVTPKQ